jgi:glycolate oxidase iron-sulfur subunit
MGLDIVEPPEGHLCCGSAGTYNMMQPDLAKALQKRKVDNIESTKPDVITAGNIGCITQIGDGTDIPVLHMVELLDWMTGGEPPKNLPNR